MMGLRLSVRGCAGAWYGAAPKAATGPEPEGRGAGPACPAPVLR